MASKLNEAISSNAGFTQKDYDSSLKLYSQYVDGVLKLELASANQVDKVKRKLYGAQEKYTKQQEAKAEKIAIQYQEQRYKHMSLLEKKAFDEKKKNDIASYREQLKDQQALQEARIKSAHMSADAEKAALAKVQNSYAKKQAEINQEELDNKKKLEKYDKVAYQRLSQGDKLKAKAQKKEEAYEEKKKKTDEARLKLLELQEKKAKDAASVSDEDMAKAQAEVNASEHEERAEKLKAANAENMSNMFASATKALFNGLNKMNNEVESAIDFIKENQSAISTRLLGTGKTYEGITGLIKSNLAVSPYVTQRATLENLAKLVDSGVAYNVEQRAFLATISDKIATTFDAFDSNLTRLIRLQQADITASRLGIEASLNNALNSMFSDTSYLKDMYDTVAGALVDAESQMTRDQATEFEYTVQKYLGALYSLGLSQSAVSQIATGIGYLGTGNIDALSGNSQLMSLLGMAASRGGVDLGSLLTGGVTGENANDLLRGMIEYLREIATSTDNMATKSSYGSVFGLGISDLRALANLTATDITNLYEQEMTYSKSLDTVQTLLNTVGGRISTTELVSNVFSNAMFSSGEALAQNPIGYIPWLVTSTIKDLTGGTAIPMVMGTGANTSIESLMQTALVGAGLLGSIGSIMSSIGSGGGVDLGKWGGTEWTVRGADWKGITGGVRTGVSLGAYIGGSGEDIKSDVLQRSQEEIKQRTGDTEAIDIEALYAALFGGDNGERKPILVEINSVTSGVKIPVNVEDTDTNPINVTPTMR